MHSLAVRIAARFGAKIVRAGDGKFADAAQRIVPAMLLPLQSREGWWQSVGGDEAGPGKTYCTSLAVLALAVKNHFLPIYQR